MYKATPSGIQRDDGVFIPADPENIDYAAYLEWVGAGNTATPIPHQDPVVPQSVTKYQCCVVLARHGLLAQTNAFFAAMASDDTRRLAWEMASTVQRLSASTLEAITHLGLSEAQADAMFIEGAQVE